MFTVVESFCRLQSRVIAVGMVSRFGANIEFCPLSFVRVSPFPAVNNDTACSRGQRKTALCSMA